jgi:hypothetical protein
MGRCSPLILQPPFWGDCVGGTDPLISSRLGSRAVAGRPAYPVASHRSIYIGRPTRGDRAGGAREARSFGTQAWGRSRRHGGVNRSVSMNKRCTRCAPILGADDAERAGRSGEGDGGRAPPAPARPAARAMEPRVRFGVPAASEARAHAARARAGADRRGRVAATRDRGGEAARSLSLAALARHRWPRERSISPTTRVCAARSR